LFNLQLLATASTSQTLRSSQPGPTTQPTPQVALQGPTRRGRSRRVATTRFKGFDDDDDDQVNLNSLPESSLVDQAPVLESQSQGLFVTQDPEMGIDHIESQTETTLHWSSRKRGTPPVDYESEEVDIMERLAPAAAALKKRRLADGVVRLLRGESTPPAPVIKERRDPKAPPEKAKIEVDLFELARKKREKAENARNEREEFEETALDVKEIEALRDLAIVEDMEVSRPSAPLRMAYADDSDRWDNKWNGRKNFKKFRRRGADSGPARDFQRVIVPLEEAKKKDFGIGDDYWLDTDAQRKKKKGRGRDTQDAFESQSQAGTKNRAATRTAQILTSEAEEKLAQAEAGQVELPSSNVEIVERSPSASPSPKPRSVAPRRTQRSEKLVDKTSTSQNSPAKNKRAASSSLAKPPPTKKARQSTRKEINDDSDDDDDDDDDDELRFKFRKRA
jgi:nijmegen breakage syndrome protein 1